MIRKISSSNFFKNALAYSGINAISQAISLLKGFIVRWILPPQIMGYWNFVSVIQGFIAAFDFGCVAGATRELPMLHGRRDPEEERIRATTLWFSLCQNIAISICALFYMNFVKTEYVPLEMQAASVGIVLFIIMTFHISYITFYSSAQAFVPLSKILLLGSIIDGVTIPLSAYLWGVNGIFIVSVVNVCLIAGVFVAIGNHMDIRIPIIIKWNTLKRLLSFGFFLRIMDYPGTLFGMINILWVTKFMSIEALALFSMAKGFSMQVIDVSTKIGTVYAMRFLNQAASGIPHSVIARQMKQYLLLQLLVVIPLLSWGAGVFLPFIIQEIIPRYSGANHAFVVLVNCGFFYVLNSGLTNPWILEKKLLKRGTANIFGLSVMTASISVSWFVLGRQTIDDIAYATIIGYCLYFSYMVVVVGRDYWSLAECVEIIVSVICAAAWTIFIMDAGFVSVTRDAGFGAHLRSSLFVAVWTLIAVLPVTIYGLKRSGVLTRLMTRKA